MQKNLSSICRKIVAVGRNYADHAKELGNVLQVDPVIFLKASSTIIEEGEAIKIPSGANELHHEVELGLVIGQHLTGCDPFNLNQSLMGFVVALDMTDRVLQNKLKAAQLPWTLAKSFDTSCPVSKVMPCSLLPSFLFSSGPYDSTGRSVELWLRVNGQERQRDSVESMIHRPFELVSFVAKRMRLEPGDLILTGTPAGVGPVLHGDVITAGIGDVCQVQFHVS